MNFEKCSQLKRPFITSVLNDYSGYACKIMFSPESEIGAFLC